MCGMAHWRLFVVYHLRSVNVIDGQAVTVQERQSADERFGQLEAG
jgi:hypothetical protein